MTIWNGKIINLNIKLKLLVFFKNKLLIYLFIFNLLKKEEKTNYFKYSLYEKKKKLKKLKKL